MRESAIQNKILQFLKQDYPDAFVVKLSDKWISGLPDILMIKDSVAYFFEVKTKGGKPSKLQIFTIKRLIKAGAQAAIVRSLTDVKKTTLRG